MMLSNVVPELENVIALISAGSIEDPIEELEILIREVRRMGGPLYRRDKTSSRTAEAPTFVPEAPRLVLLADSLNSVLSCLRSGNSDDAAQRAAAALKAFQES